MNAISALLITYISGSICQVPASSLSLRVSYSVPYFYFVSSFSSRSWVPFLSMKNVEKTQNASKHMAIIAVTNLKSDHLR